MICSSDKLPNVTTPKDWVCPRVNNADPCVLGSTSTLEAKGLISVKARPSGLILSSVISRRTSSFTILSNDNFASFTISSSSSSVAFSSNTSRTFSLTAEIASSRSCLSLIAIASFIWANAIERTSL